MSSGFWAVPVSLWMTYRIGHRVFNPVAASIACVLLAVTPDFLRWSLESHPDFPQLFWVLCALLACCRLANEFRLRWILLASLFAGLAFGTKYIGIFLLPVIALAASASRPGGVAQHGRRSPTDERLGLLEGSADRPMRFCACLCLYDSLRCRPVWGIHGQSVSLQRDHGIRSRRPRRRQRDNVGRGTCRDIGKGRPADFCLCPG